MDAFNKDNAGRFHATRLPLLESRDGMKAILEGKVKPVIFTPSSPVWIARLNEVYAQQNPTVSVADMDDPKAFRYLLRSPLVIVTTKGKAAFYSRLFQGPEPWHRIRELSMGTTHTPWGSFKFAHAGPLDATSGMLTMSLIVNEYVSESGLNEPTEEIVKDPAFKQWLAELETKFVRDPAAVGSSALERAFVADPTSRDFITAYESKGLEAVEKNPNLTIIYPSITNEAQQSLIVLNAPWVTDQARKGAVAFLDYLQSPKAQHDALALHFRPVTDTSGTALASVLTPQEKAVYHDSYITSSLPDYATLNEAANQWRLLTGR